MRPAARAPAPVVARLHLPGMTHRIGSKGQVVIPKHLREQRGFGAGTAVSFEDLGDGILIRRAEPERRLKGRFERSGMSARLLEDRAREPR